MKLYRLLGRTLPLIAALVTGQEARATSYTFTFSSGDVSGDLIFTVGSSALTDDPTNSLPITSITGTITDASDGDLNELVSSIVAINPVPGDPEAPHSFSVYSTTGNSYDNLYYVNDDSPVVCTGYPFSGGVLDIYGVAFTLDNGQFVNVWSNGVYPEASGPSYQAAVTPEPSTWAMMALGFAGLGIAGYRGSRKSAAVA